MNQKCPRCRKNNSPLGMVIVADLCTRIEYACDCGCKWQDFKDIVSHFKTEEPRQDPKRRCKNCLASKPINGANWYLDGDKRPATQWCKSCTDDLIRANKAWLK